MSALRWRGIGLKKGTLRESSITVYLPQTRTMKGSNQNLDEWSHTKYNEHQQGVQNLRWGNFPRGWTHSLKHSFEPCIALFDALFQKLNRGSAIFDDLRTQGFIIHAKRQNHVRFP